MTLTAIKIIFLYTFVFKLFNFHYGILMLFLQVIINYVQLSSKFTKKLKSLGVNHNVEFPRHLVLR